MKPATTDQEFAKLKLAFTEFIDKCRKAVAVAMPSGGEHLRDANYLFFGLEARWMDAKKKIGAAVFFNYIYEVGHDKLIGEMTKAYDRVCVPVNAAWKRCGWGEEAVQ